MTAYGRTSPVLAGSLSLRFGMQPIVCYLNKALASASGVAAELPRLARRVAPRSGFDLQPIVHRLNTASAFLADLPERLNRLRRSPLRERPTAPVEVTAPAPRLGVAREWEMVLGVLTRDLARVPAVAAIHAQAALKIDAAEHALGRIIADCSKVLAAPPVPARRPVRRLVHRAELRIRRQLAA
jgi:hypothetical protein